jgi:hypothetical protein
LANNSNLMGSSFLPMSSLGSFFSSHLNSPAKSSLVCIALNRTVCSTRKKVRKSTQPCSFGSKRAQKALLEIWWPNRLCI